MLRMTFGMLVLRTAVAVACVLTATGAVAATPRHVLRVVAQRDACPPPAMVEAELKRAVPEALLDGSDNALVVGYVDAGDRYSVFFGAAQREFIDPERRCDERARAIAVYVSLLLDGPTEGAPSPVPRVEPPVAGPTRAAPAPASAPASVTPPSPSAALLWWRRQVADLHVDVEAGGLLALSPSAGPPFAVGGQAKVAVMLGQIGVALGAGALSRARIPVAGKHARLLRVPIVVDIEGTMRRGPVEGVLGVGAMIAAVHATGDGFLTEQSGAGVEGAFHLALAVRYWLGRWYPFLSTEAVFGGGSGLTVDGAEVGQTPLVWLSIAAGVGVRLR